MVNEEQLKREHASLRQQIRQAEATINQAQGAIALIDHFLAEINKAKLKDQAEAAAAKAVTAVSEAQAKDKVKRRGKR